MAAGQLTRKGPLGQSPGNLRASDHPRYSGSDEGSVSVLFGIRPLLPCRILAGRALESFKDTTQDLTGIRSFLRSCPVKMDPRTADMRSARAGCVGGNVGVGCVKALARTPKETDKPLCVKRNKSNPPDNAKSFRIAKDVPYSPGINHPCVATRRPAHLRLPVCRRAGLPVVPPGWSSRSIARPPFRARPE